MARKKPDLSSFALVALEDELLTHEPVFGKCDDGNIIAQAEKPEFPIRGGNNYIVIDPERDSRGDDFIINYIIQTARRDEAMVIVDADGSLEKTMRRRLTRFYGYKVNTLNFRDPEKSRAWFPMEELLGCKEDEEEAIAAQYALTLLNTMRLNMDREEELRFERISTVVYPLLKLIIWSFAICKQTDIDELDNAISYLLTYMGLKSASEKPDYEPKCRAEQQIFDRLDDFFSITNQDAIRQAQQFVNVHFVDLFCGKKFNHIFNTRSRGNLNAYKVGQGRSAIFVQMPDKSSPLYPCTALFINYLMDIFTRQSSCAPDYQTTALNIILNASPTQIGYIAKLRSYLWTLPYLDVNTVMRVDSLDEFTHIYSDDGEAIVALCDVKLLVPTERMASDTALMAIFNANGGLDTNGKAAIHNRIVLMTKACQDPVVLSSINKNRLLCCSDPL